MSGELLEVDRLTSVVAARLIEGGLSGRYADGGGLYLVVEENGAARWSFFSRREDSARSSESGRPWEMSLGSAAEVTLHRAREKAFEVMRLVEDGMDPATSVDLPARIPTFGTLADKFIAIKILESDSKPSQNRTRRLLNYYAAELRPLRVDAIDTNTIVELLRPIWLSKPETARKVRSSIENVLNAAKAHGLRDGQNPAVWHGHLDHLLPKHKRICQHHAAMERERLPDFVLSLSERPATAALALEFLILNAARVGEVIRATWEEIDFDSRVWTRPAPHMKNRLSHRVPLSKAALSVLDKAAKLEASPFIFPSREPSKPLSNAAFDRLMRRMRVVGITTHGFRSTFRDWAGEVSNFPRELAEMALAHTVGDATERAYARGDMLEKRRMMMEAWGSFCTSHAVG